MSVGDNDLARTVKAMRPMVPARDFETSKRFYEELGFRPQILSDGLVEMYLGAYSFIGLRPSTTTKARHHRSIQWARNNDADKWQLGGA